MKEHNPVASIYDISKSDVKELADRVLALRKDSSIEPVPQAAVEDRGFIFSIWYCPLKEDFE